MSSNKAVRERLEMIYGKGCMFQKAHIAKRIEEMGGIKTYKKFKEEKKYTLKKERYFEKQMTLHHLKHRSEGGDTSIRNGAEISTLAHQYMHSLPRHQEEIINNMLRQYKIEYATLSTRGISKPQIIELELNDMIEIPLIPNEAIKQKAKQKTKGQIRAKEKRDLRRIMEELDYEKQ